MPLHDHYHQGAAADIMKRVESRDDLTEGYDTDKLKDLAAMGQVLRRRAYRPFPSVLRRCRVEDAVTTQRRRICTC